LYDEGRNQKVDVYHTKQSDIKYEYEHAAMIKSALISFLPVTGSRLMRYSTATRS
jgi:hypothetical protein